MPEPTQQPDRSPSPPTAAVGMATLTVRALRAVLAVLLAGATVVQAGLVWVLVSGRDPEDGSAALAAFRVLAIVGLVAVQVGLVCLWRLATMARRDTVFSTAAFRYVDALTGAIVAAAAVWFTVTAVNAPGQRDDPGVTAIMAGIGLGIVGVALVVRVLRTLLAQAVARDTGSAHPAGRPRLHEPPAARPPSA